jgi:hypothetical protein
MNESEYLVEAFANLLPRFRSVTRIVAAATSSGVYTSSHVMAQSVVNAPCGPDNKVRSVGGRGGCFRELQLSFTSCYVAREAGCCSAQIRVSRSQSILKTDAALRYKFVIGGILWQGSAPPNKDSCMLDRFNPAGIDDL